MVQNDCPSSSQSSRCCGGDASRAGHGGRGKLPGVCFHASCLGAGTELAVEMPTALTAASCQCARWEPGWRFLPPTEALHCLLQPSPATVGTAGVCEPAAGGFCCPNKLFCNWGRFCGLMVKLLLSCHLPALSAWATAPCWCTPWRASRGIPRTQVPLPPPGDPGCNPAWPWLLWVFEE